jgi:hypothetical protein
MVAADWIVRGEHRPCASLGATAGDCDFELGMTAQRAGCPVQASHGRGFDFHPLAV